MLDREIMAVCSEIHTKHINALCGQNVELLNVKSNSTNLTSYKSPTRRYAVPQLHLVVTFQAFCTKDVTCMLGYTNIYIYSN